MIAIAAGGLFAEGAEMLTGGAHGVGLIIAGLALFIHAVARKRATQ